ncbi:MAG: NUDIX domain-containing protein [Clostridia bacterium]|nr:NUDIX domain-containing protein [Clostridia bacterium]
MQYEKACGAVVFTRVDGEIKYVIVQELEGHHGFPKGHVEGDETEIQTALREIWEETGLRPRLIDGFRMVSEHPLPNKPGVIKQIVYFAAEYKDQPIKLLESELLSVGLYTFEQAMSMFEYETSKEVLLAANEFITKYIKN